MAQDFDCPTGTCEEQEPRCRDIEIGDPIDPNSVAHLERNECNTCPRSPPEPVYLTVRAGSPRTGFYEQQQLVGFHDCEGNEWSPDNKWAAHNYHGDPHWIWPRDLNSTTYRVVRKGSVRGWQCRYVEGMLDDVSLDMGTYDYADSSTWLGVRSKIPATPVFHHGEMDVEPHEANGNYVPNLTTVICR